MKRFAMPGGLPLIRTLSATLALCVSVLHAQPANPANRVPLFLTATNGSTNYLAVVNTRTHQVSYVPTGGNGGAGGNAGGVAVSGEMAAVVNFGSSNVTIFARRGDSMQAAQMITTSSKPVSVAFGHDHLFVLGQTAVQSFAMPGNMVSANADGSVSLIKGDGTAGQIVSFDGGVMYTETSGDIGMIGVGIPGLAGPSVPVALPAAPNNDTPLGMIGRGANVYVTIAHSDLEALVVGGKIVSTATGPTPFKDASGNLLHAPCWNALAGQFLYSADSPGKQLLRYLVSDSNVFFDKGAVATLGGAPTDLAVVGNMLGVIDGGDASGANASVFDISPEGELSLQFSVKIGSAINGAAFIR
ncbi:MAG TPA: hypothetical protein VGL72_18085 [Bryobacteraceae bacterium]